MIFKLSGYTLHVDVEKTREYYKTAALVRNSCSCIMCSNFECAADSSMMINLLSPVEINGAAC